MAARRTLPRDRWRPQRPLLLGRKGKNCRSGKCPFDYPLIGPRPAVTLLTPSTPHGKPCSGRWMLIASHADNETLYDQPAVAKDKLRITGPFTVEAVPASLPCSH